VLHQQETIRRPSGSSLPVLVSALALPSPAGAGQLAPGGELVALVVHQDVSALKEAEQLKDEFIGVAAHELRNPIAALKGFATMLVYQTARGKGAKLSGWQQEAIEEIEQATTRLDKLTEDLLDVTRLQAGRLALTPKPTDLVTLTRHMMAQVHMTTSQHTFSLETELSSLIVEIDQGRIEQVLGNLLSNAVKYSPQRGPIELTLHEEVEPHVALLTIRDRGMGIPAHQQARIFGRFVRAENARASEITGTGLGLYLSRELVERHGGRLWFESTEGEGTTFFLTLPLVAPLQKSDVSHHAGS
jgi:signal transduction histidine kinase